MDILKKTKWILLAIVLFAIGHYTIRSAANNLSFSDPSFTEYRSWLNVLALALYFVCGVVASYLSQKQFLLTGAITGLLSALTAILAFHVAVNDLGGKVITLITGIVLGFIGGAVARLVSRRWAHAL